MDLSTPFTGTLLLPDKAFAQRESPVTLPDGTVVAQLTWRTWTMRNAFEILDPYGREVAQAGAEGLFRKRYAVWRPDGTCVLQLSISAWLGTSGKSMATLPTGAQLTVQGTWGGRRFTITDAHGTVVGAISPTNGSFSFRPDAYEFVLHQPALSIVQAAGLAQSLRTAAKGSRAAAGASASN